MRELTVRGTPTDRLANAFSDLSAEIDARNRKITKKRVSRMSANHRKALVTTLVKEREPERLAKSLVGAIHENESLRRLVHMLIELKADGREDLVRELQRQRSEIREWKRRSRHFEGRVEVANQRVGYFKHHLKRVAAKHQRRWWKLWSPRN